MHRRPALNLIATLYFIGQSEDFPIEQKKTPYPLTGTDVLDSAVPPFLTAVFLPPSLCFSNAKAHVLLLTGSSKAGSLSSREDLPPAVLSLCHSEQVLFLFIATFLFISLPHFIGISLFCQDQTFYSSSSIFRPVGLY